MAHLLGTCAVLLMVANAVTLHAATISQIQSHKKSASSVDSGAEAASLHKADAAELKTSFMRKSPFSEKNGTAHKVDMDVYYETRCPGCLLFLNQTLEPLWRNKNNSDIFNINLYTYGNGMTVPTVNISEGYKFWHPESTGDGWNTVQICQHGSDECMGNLVQVCAKNLTDHEKHMNLVFCMSASTIAGYGVEKSTYECMDQVGIDKNKIRDCVTSPHGNNLLNEVGEFTAKLQGRTGTPWVMVGGEHVADEVLMNSTLLLQSVCKHVQNVPVPCAPFHGAPEPSSQPDSEPADPDFVVLEDMQAQDLIKVSDV
jgi:hypothetical protein